MEKGGSYIKPESFELLIHGLLVAGHSVCAKNNRAIKFATGIRKNIPI